MNQIIKKVAITIALFAMVIVVSGCQTDAEYLNDLVVTQKTITTPPGNRGITGAVKKMFSRHGYEIFVYGGPKRTVGTIGTETDIVSGKAFLSNFSLYLSQEVIDICLNGEGYYRFDISIVDNTNGKEVFVANGHGCVGSKTKELEGKLQRFWR